VQSDMRLRKGVVCTWSTVHRLQRRGVPMTTWNLTGSTAPGAATPTDGSGLHVKARSRIAATLRPSRVTTQVERLSFRDDSLLGGYAESIDRLAFAAASCRNRHVLDAGCGTGLGARYLLDHGAISVVGVDLSAAAIDEARSLQPAEKAQFLVGDLHDLEALTAGSHRFGAIVSFETLAHLEHPQRFLAAVARRLDEGGTFIVSTPNRDAIPLDDEGRPLYRFQHIAYSPEALESHLRTEFREVSVWGQWLSPSGRLRKLRAMQQFRYLCDSYYQPAARVTRWLKGLVGGAPLPPPDCHVAADSYPGDYEIRPIRPARLPWAPTTLLAICRN